jgi:hypothetical protein
MGRTLFSRIKPGITTASDRYPRRISELDRPHYRAQRRKRSHPEQKRHSPLRALVWAGCGGSQHGEYGAHRRIIQPGYLCGVARKSHPLKNMKSTYPALERTPISLPLFYLLESGIINIAYITIGTIVLIVLSTIIKINTLTVLIILYVLLEKGLIIGLVTSYFHTRSFFNKESGSKFIGFYFGRFYGIIIGGFVGLKIGSSIGLVIGGVSFYILGRWVGPKIGNLTNRLISSKFSVTEPNPGPIVKSIPSKNVLTILYAVIFPLVFVVIALFVYFLHLDIAVLPREWLSVARIVIITLSLFFILYPWFMPKGKIQTQIIKNNMVLTSEFIYFLIGMLFAFVPVIYGFLLFIMGASIFEFCLYVIVSSTAVIIWSVNN